MIFEVSTGSKASPSHRRVWPGFTIARSIQTAIAWQRPTVSVRVWSARAEFCSTPALALESARKRLLAGLILSAATIGWPAKISASSTTSPDGGPGGEVTDAIMPDRHRRYLDCDFGVWILDKIGSFERGMTIEVVDPVTTTPS